MYLRQPHCFAVVPAVAATMVACSQPEPPEPASPPPPVDVSPPSTPEDDHTPPPTPGESQPPAGEPLESAPEEPAPELTPAPATPSEGSGTTSAPNATQLTGPNPAPPESGIPAPAATTYSDETIDAFAQAYIETLKVQLHYQQKLEAATSASEVERIQKRALTDIPAAVHDQDGISLQEFEQIQLDAGQDPALRLRVEQAMQRHAPQQGEQP